LPGKSRSAQHRGRWIFTAPRTVSCCEIPHRAHFRSSMTLAQALQTTSLPRRSTVTGRPWWRSRGPGGCCQGWPARSGRQNAVDAAADLKLTTARDIFQAPWELEALVDHPAPWVRLQYRAPWHGLGRDRAEKKTSSPQARFAVPGSLVSCTARSRAVTAKTLMKLLRCRGRKAEVARACRRSPQWGEGLRHITHRVPFRPAPARVC